MKKKIILTLALILVTNLAAAQDIEITEFDMPGSAEVSEEISVSAKAQADDKIVEIIGLEVDGSSDEKSCGEPVYCERQWTLTFYEEGEKEVTITAEDRDGITASKTKEIDITGYPYEIESSSAQRNGENVDLTLELEDDLPDDYTCRWGENSDITTSDSLLNRESDDKFETSFEESGSGEVWVACLDSSGNRVTDNIKESYGGEEGLEIEDSSAEHLGDGEVEFRLELNRDLSEEYSCRWSENSDITTSDEVMDRESDSEFEASGNFEQGSHEVWMGCIDSSSNLVTEKVREEFDIGDEKDVKADFTYSPSNPDAGDTVTFDASNSEGEIEDYSWSFSDGGSAEGLTVSRSYDSAGYYSATLTVEGDEESDSITKTLQAGSADAAGLEVDVEDEEGGAVDAAKITVMDLGTQRFETISTSEENSYRDSSRDKGDSEVGLSLERDTLTTYAEYHSGYRRRAWNNLALQSSGGNEVVFRFDLAADRQQSQTRSYRSEQSIELTEGEKEVTIILTVNGDKVSSFTSLVDAPGEHEFSKVEDASGVEYRGNDRRITDAPSFPTYTEYTDSSGEASFDLPSGRYTVTATKSGYYSDRKNLDLTSGETENAILELEQYRTEDQDESEENQEGVVINSVSVPPSVCSGETLNARVTVENTDSSEREYSLSAEGLSSEIRRSYYLEAGEKETKVLTFLAVEGEGNQKVEFTTETGSVQKTVQVRGCDTGLQGLSASVSPTEPREGQAVQLTGVLKGTGRREVDITVAGTRERTVSTEPDGRFNAYVTPPRTGEQEIKIESQGITRTRKINVLPRVNLFNLNAPDSVFEDETFNVCGRVESPVSSLVLLKKEGETVDSKNGKGNICFEQEEDPGIYRYQIRALNQGSSSSASKTVEVLEQGSEARAFPDKIASVQSGSGMVKIDLYNNNDQTRTYDIELEGLPKGWASQTTRQVSLGKGEKTTEHIYFSPEQEGEYEASLTIDSEGEQVYSEKISISSGGTGERPSLVDRIMLWFRYG